MISQEYSIAISETLEILNHTRKEDVDKIPMKFLIFLQEHASRDYTSSLDFNKSLKEMTLKPKTIGILSIINKKFWCNDEQRKIFEEKLKQNEIKYQKKLREKYNFNKLFIKKELKINKPIVETIELIEYKGSIFHKIINWFKHFANR